MACSVLRSCVTCAANARGRPSTQRQTSVKRCGGTSLMSQSRACRSARGRAKRALIESRASQRACGEFIPRTRPDDGSRRSANAEDRARRDQVGRRSGAATGCICLALERWQQRGHAARQASPPRSRWRTDPAHGRRCACSSAQTPFRPNGQLSDRSEDPLRAGTGTLLIARTEHRRT
jgi:hypothetical protein